MEQRRDGRGGRRDANIDDVPEIGVTCGRERPGRGGHGYERQLPGGSYFSF